MRTFAQALDTTSTPGYLVFRVNGFDDVFIKLPDYLEDIEDAKQIAERALNDAGFKVVGELSVFADDITELLVQRY